MPLRVPAWILALTVFAGLAARSNAQSMTVDSFDGPVTSNEVASFRTFMAAQAPATWDTTGGMENEYAQGHSGENVKALGLMYELSGDTGILDRMIAFCDVLLSQRNDLLAAPQGQQVYNTGTIAPAWPSSLTGSPIYSTSASGDCAGHLAYCAKLILQNPALWNLSPSGGDPFGFGGTYLLRAQRYVAEADACFDRYFFPYMLDLSAGNVLKYTTTSPYQPGNQLPWNQAMMMVYPLQNLAVAHEILGDDPARVAKYDSIVSVNVGRFFTDPAVRIIYADPDRQTAYNWSYTPTSNSGEDSNHGALDVAGFYRAFRSGRYGVTTAQMVPFANMFCDVMTRTIGSDYAGRVDGTDGTGHASPTTYVRSAYLLLAEFRPDQYYNLMAGARLTAGGSTGSADAFSRAMWEKQMRYVASQAFTFAVTPTSPTVVAGSSAMVTATVTPQPGFTGTLSLSVSGLPAGVTATVNPTDLPAGSSAISLSAAANAIPGVYPLLVRATSGTITQVVPVDLYVSSTTMVTAPSFAPPGGTYTTVQSVTLSTPTPGASIRYTTDGSTPSATAGTLYSGPISVTATTTVKAVAVAAGMTDSLVSAATYTLNLPPTAAPVFSVPAGMYGQPQVVSIGSTTPGASIRYTLDGSIPTATSGNVYTGPVSVAYTNTLNAVAFASGYSISALTSADYVIGGSTPAPVISSATTVADSTHATGYVPGNTIDGDLSTRWAAKGDGVWIQYDLGSVNTLNRVAIAWYLGTARTYTFDLQVSSDGLAWTTVLNRRASSGATTGFEAYTFAPVVGQFVRIVGHLSSVDAYTNIVEVQLWGSPTGAPAVVAPPIFSPAAGTYVGPQAITISSPTPGATIRYTMDGSTPTATSGTAYTGPLTLASDATIKAIASAPGLLDSAVATAAYTITSIALPRGWSNTDVGSPTPAGSSTYTAGVFTVKGAGADVWTSSDQFQYAWSAATGDATLTARVASAQNTNVSAKFGVMIRESIAANSRYVFMLLLPTKGVALQYRSATGGNAAQLSTSTGPTAPYWVRLVRAGNSFTGYTSPDGATWTARGTVTVNMAAAALAGLAVCSHATGTLATGTFDNVALTLTPSAAPTFSPAPGSYDAPQTVTIASATPDATITYTTDGSAPSATNGRVYSGPLQLDYATTTLKAQASAPGLADSVVSTGVFDIKDVIPPVLSLPANLVVEATGPAGAVASFTGTAVDNRDGPVPVIFSPASGSVFPLGTTTVTATSTDSSGNQATGTFTVTVQDTTPPAIASLTATPSVLWPPNHKMVPVSLAARVADAVDPAPRTRIVSVVSNEPANASGDGNTAVDWEITGDMRLNVRAERSGQGIGRVYTVTVESRDASGNASTETTAITVPVSRGTP